MILKGECLLGKTDKDNTFHYTYSAAQQKEIRQIRAKYDPQAMDKLEQLRRLDRRATRKARVFTALIALAGALLFGIGLCCALVWKDCMIWPGLPVGVAGIALIIAAFPLNKRLIRRQREKIAPQIMQLSDELLK